jgi:transglutaminase-like putative cysteine protease
MNFFLTQRSAKIVAAACAMLASGVIATGHNEHGTARRPDAKDTYTITSTLQLVRPFNLKDMTDDFQDARLIASDADTCTVEITYYPLYRPAIGENPNWRKDYAGMTEYLRPTATENWNEQMRLDLLAELRAADIDPERLTDKQLVEQVSRWAMKRSRSTSAFAIWTFHYPEGKPEVFPALRGAFEREKSKAGKTEQEMFEQEALGRSMFYDKVRGSCTSSSIYLTTIFRALGIPTRIVFCIPPFDANDSAQAEMFYGAIHHHDVRETVRKALDGMRGFVNHLFNEVYVGNRWVRLNYSNLGQPILDARYFGLLTHIYTSSDLSQVPLAETWGLRFFRYREAESRLSSVNPYRLISVRDRFGDSAKVDNPAVAPPPELTTATIIAVLRPNSPALPKFVLDGWKPGQKRPDFLVSFKEWMPGSYLQMRVFQQRVGQEFILSAADRPDLRARLLDWRMSKGDGSFQAYCAEVVAADRDKIVPGLAYTIKPINISETYRWELGADLKPITLKD